MQRILTAGFLRAREHWGLVLVLALSLALRVATQVAYWPALRFYDSFSYLHQADSGLFLNPFQPGGYPQILRLVRLASSNLALLSSLQHLGGLATGLMVYLLVWRTLGLKLLAAVGAAVVMLNARLIAVEQYVMTDAFFTVMVTVSAALLILASRRPALLSSGLLLGLACTVRPVGLFCIPVWIAFVLWRYRLSPTMLIGVLAVLLPVVLYAAMNDRETGHFSMTADTAWVAYGRVAPVADCSKLTLPARQRTLCPTPEQRQQSLTWFVLNGSSPAVRAFGSPSLKPPRATASTMLGFARRVALQRPLPVLGVIASDLLRYLTPAARAVDPDIDVAITLPKPGPLLRPPFRYSPSQRTPAGALRAYASVFRVGGAELTLLLVLALVGLFSARLSSVRSPTSQRAAVASLFGFGAALLLGAALTVGYQRRYDLPSVPLLSAAGMIGVAGLAQWVQRRRRQPSGATPSPLHGAAAGRGRRLPWRRTGR